MQRPCYVPVPLPGTHPNPECYSVQLCAIEAGGMGWPDGAGGGLKQEDGS